MVTKAKLCRVAQKERMVFKWVVHQSAMSRYYAIFCVHNFEVYGLTWQKCGSNMEPQPTRQGLRLVLFDECFRNTYSRVSAMSLGPHAHQIYLPAISFFGVTSNQKSTFENLVQSKIWKFPFAKKLQQCHKNVSKFDAELWGDAPDACTAIRTPSFLYSLP